MASFNLQSHKDNVFSSFKLILEKTEQRLQTVGVHLRPYHSPELFDFKALTSSQQKSALEDAVRYLETLEQAQEKGWSLTDDKRLLWAALKILGYTPTSDIFEYLPSGSVLEVYNLNGIQIWRNLKFMEICSYTLEEMFCYSWQERYERDEEASKEVLYFVEGVLNAKEKKTVFCPVHNTVTERFSEECYILDTHHEIISPILKGNVPMGFIVASKVNIIGNNKKKKLAEDNAYPPLGLV